MKHQHSHPKKSHLKLRWIFLLSFFYMLAEIIGGFWSNSLALLADAGHMAIDTAAVGLGLFASWISSKPATEQKTYGYYRAEILVALINGIVLFVASFWILYEAWSRLSEPHEIKGQLMSWVAMGGLLVNLIGVKLLHSHSHESLNLRGVWLHLLSDLLGSISAILAGFLVWKFNWVWADTASSALISVFILVGAWRLMGEAVHVLLEGAPSQLETSKIKEALEKVPGVKGVFDLHVWVVSSGVSALSCHVVAESYENNLELLEKLNAVLEKDFSLSHNTIQIEPEGFHRGDHEGNHCSLDKHQH